MRSNSNYLDHYLAANKQFSNNKISDFNNSLVLKSISSTPISVRYTGAP